MTLLILYLGITLIGYFVGSYLRKKEKKITFIGKIQTVAVLLLVLLMGSRLGANEDVVKGLDTIGLSAFILTLFVLAGSLIAIFVTRKLLKINREGMKSNE